MKLLVLGPDGGDPDVIRGMDMPCLQGILASNELLPVKEDLWSRGWAKIMSGRSGEDLGAFYEQPALDGTRAFTQSFGTASYDKCRGCDPLWQKLNGMGVRVGMLNIPTTFPAPEVDGFIVSGAGGGYSPASRLPDLACYPQEIRQELLDRRFQWEVRFVVSGIRTVDCFFDRCLEAIDTRTRIFVDLCKKYRVDMGFIVQKEVVILENLFMQWIDRMLKMPDVELIPIQRRLREFFRVLDDCFKYTINELSPDHVMVVSDHSARVYEKSMNLNAFLQDAGHLQHTPHLPLTQIRRFKRNLKREWIRRFRGNPFAQDWPFLGHVDFDNSRAFSHFYVPGIYLNDDRFLGPVKGHERADLIDRIIDDLGKDRTAGEHGIKGFRYRERYRDSPHESLLPDIGVEHPETFFPEARGEFVQDNPYGGPFTELGNAPRDIMSGKKGSNALLSVEKRFSEGLVSGGSCDLSSAYQAIVNHFL